MHCCLQRLTNSLVLFDQVCSWAYLLTHVTKSSTDLKQERSSDLQGAPVLIQIRFKSHWLLKIKFKIWLLRIQWSTLVGANIHRIVFLKKVPWAAKRNMTYLTVTEISTDHSSNLHHLLDFRISVTLTTRSCKDVLNFIMSGRSIMRCKPYS